MIDRYKDMHKFGQIMVKFNPTGWLSPPPCSSQCFFHFNCLIVHLTVRGDSGAFDDVNPVTRGQSSYDADGEEEDRGVDSDGEGYISDSSSQDTVRERSLQRNSGKHVLKLKLIINFKICFEFEKKYDKYFHVSCAMVP